jgi:carboxymethylenebutenolidase
MRERIIEIATTDGRMEAFVTHPERRGPFPAVVVFMDVWGIREELYDIARRIATTGYYAVVPDLYYRLGRVRNAYRGPDGKMLSLQALPKEDQDKVLAPQASLSDTMVVADAGALIAHLAAAAEAGEPVRPDVMGAIGYCMGGRYIMSVAAAYPDQIKASAGLHPTGLISERVDSPHKAAAQLRGELYFGFAEHDPYTPRPMIDELAALVRPFPVIYQYSIHKGAKHGYALPDRDVYDKQAANRDWEIIFDIYRRQIPPA